MGKCQMTIASAADASAANALPGTSSSSKAHSMTNYTLSATQQSNCTDIGKKQGKAAVNKKFASFFVSLFFLCRTHQF